MAGSVIVLAHPGGVTNKMWADIAVGECYLDSAGNLFVKIDVNSCINLQTKTTAVGPAAGYACDVMISATYK